MEAQEQEQHAEPLLPKATIPLEPLIPLCNERSTSSSSLTFHWLPASGLARTVSPLLIVSLFFQVVHAGLAVASLSTDWSKTIVHFIEEEGSFVHPGDETLYPSDFWLNVKNFHDSGAMPLAVLLVMTGVGQPLMKMASMGFLSFRALHPPAPTLHPHTPSTSRLSFLIPSPRVSLMVLETCGKLTMIASNVGCTLLTAVTITFVVEDVRREMDAEAITDTLMGTEFCLLATLAACFATALLRDVHSNALQKKWRSSFLHNPSKRTSSHASSHSSQSPVSYTRMASLASNPNRSSAAARTAGIVSTLQPSVLVLMVLFIIPAFTMDAVEFNYTGVGARHLKDDVTTVRVKMLTFGNNLVADTPSAFYGGLNITSFYFNNIICPIVAVVGAVLIRIKKSSPGIVRMTRWAFTFSMLDAVIIAIFFVAPEVSMISKWIFDDSISVCQTLTEDTDDNCLVITGKILTGGWFLCAAAICFDIFLIVTLWNIDEDEMEKNSMRDEMNMLIKKNNANAIMEGTKETEEGEAGDTRYVGLDVRVPDNV